MPSYTEIFFLSPEKDKQFSSFSKYSYFFCSLGVQLIVVVVNMRFEKKMGILGHLGGSVD